MIELPNLDELDHAAKDALIMYLWPLIAKVEQLEARILELEARLALNSKNSSKPPSSDGFNKPQPKSLRKAKQRPNGGQKGHTGHTLRQSTTPDEVIVHKLPPVCDACSVSLLPRESSEVRQVFDIPQPRAHVTEHRVEYAVCVCGKEHHALFPSDISFPVQFGPVAQAAMVHLNQYHMLPLKRTCEIMAQMMGLSSSQASVINACTRAKQTVSGTVDAIAQAIQKSAVAHADETGIRVNKKLHWMHIAATQTLTWMACHTKRGTLALGDLKIWPSFQGVLVHDGWKPYQTLSCLHSLCNAHHLRELTHIHEEFKQDWAGDMIALLVHANKQVSEQYQRDPHHVAHWRYVYDMLLAVAEEKNPRNMAPSGKRGRIKQSKATNLIERLRTYSDDVWRFATNPAVPFTNNIAEQAVRMPKVKQKIAGCFRTKEGADTFCTLRSYLATMAKQGFNTFECLVQAFKGNVLQPKY